MIVAVRESVIEAQLRRVALRCGGVPIKLAQGQGLPDRVVVWPGRVEFVETKRPSGGALSALQAATIRGLRSKGFSVSVVWTSQDVREMERKWRGNGGAE